MPVSSFEQIFIYSLYVIILLFLFPNGTLACLNLYLVKPITLGSLLKGGMEKVQGN